VKIVYTDEALRDIDHIADWLTARYPTVAPIVGRRIQTVIARIAKWPQSARTVPARPDVRAVPLGRYPYVVFYRVTANAVKILYVHHAAQQLTETEAP
jgi:plasmid stabilization system protein ParE